MKPKTSDPFIWSYAISKQLPSCYALSSNYGDIDLSEDDELRVAVVAAVRPILERRLEEAELEGAGR